jgi:cytochrome b subunit of formate dehydrogenase
VTKDDSAMMCRKNLVKTTTKHLLCILSLPVFLYAGLMPVQALATEGGDLADVTCLSCHADNRKEIQVPSPVEEGKEKEMRPLLSINGNDYKKAVHGALACIDCHSNIVDSKSDHNKSELPDPDCAGCHTDLWQGYTEKNLVAENKRMGVVAQNIETYKKSAHAIPTKDGFKAYCDDCHHSHEFNVPPSGTLEHKDWRLTIPKVCAECHEDRFNEYKNSVHGKGVLQEHNSESAVCTDCHTSHGITRTTRDPFQLAVTKECGSCHQDNFETYRNTYHGQINTLGYSHTAKCYNCHGSHEILDVNDPESTIHPDNRIKTCEQCHDGVRVMQATENFLTFGPHANTLDYDRYPQVWIASMFMRGLLLFVFGFFWVHSILWWVREYKDRKAGGGHTRVRTDELQQEQGKQVRRFGLIWRIGHLLFALSVMMLILTGMAVFYSYTAWAPMVIDALGGPAMAGLVHRICAVIMLGIFFLHIIGVFINIYKNRKTFRWFGPDSLVPNWKDLHDAWGMFKWFINKGPRPIFDRWTYWEKFDYWAVFWGMVVIGGSGMMLSFPEVTASIFPGWSFNVVMLVHGEEAFLTAVFLFTVHFFNNHFRPYKLPPPDVVMFTGTQSLEEFKRDHRMQYDRLVETGQLEKYLVDVPSRPMTIGSKILGLTLIACGLALLIVVAIGFFGG